MEKKPSSIEWLVDQFKEYDFSEDDGMYLIKIPSWLLTEKEEQAKAMHKKESKLLFECGRNFQLTGEGTFTQVYNETFGGDDE
jgi:hypothetical protein